MPCLRAIIADLFAAATAVLLVVYHCCKHAAAKVLAAQHAVLRLEQLDLLDIKNVWQVVFLRCVFV